jgi:two-component system nitrate/nitrite response regulator NarL
MTLENGLFRPNDNDGKGGDGRIRVLVVASVRLYREGMSFSLETRDSLKVVGCSATCEEAMCAVTALNPEVAVVDMATDRSLDLVCNLKKVVPSVKVIAFAVEDHDSEIIACAEAGVDGYVTPEGSMDDLTQTILSVTRGELLCSPRIAATLLRRVSALAKDVREPHTPCGLTSREYEIAGLIEAGLSNKEIAVRLHVEVCTVKNHVHNLLAKLQVGSRAEAAGRIGLRSANHASVLAPPSLSARTLIAFAAKR